MHPVTTEIYTLSLHDALPICVLNPDGSAVRCFLGPDGATVRCVFSLNCTTVCRVLSPRSEEHTSELQSLRHLVCRLLLEKNNPPVPAGAIPARSPCRRLLAAL